MGEEDNYMWPVDDPEPQESGQSSGAVVIPLYRVTWGIHSGTLMSRDICDEFKANTLDEAKLLIKKYLKFFKSRGLKLWFANAINTETNEKVILMDGIPYS
ncbi:MAG: hypothetical protein GY775_18480 [Candidatus Scalindua sp.]|nr:hypothetical protein [Candidatus Scalindua sp.]